MPPFTLTPRPPVVVRFEGLPDREGAMTLGQRNIMRWITDAVDDFDMTVGSRLMFPDGIRLDDVAEVLGALIARHEGLRTTFEDGADPRQHVHGAGAVAIEVYEVDRACPQPDQKVELGAELNLRFRPGSACGLGQFPVWTAVAVHDGLVQAGFVKFSHLIVDEQAVTLLGGEFAEMIMDPAARVPGPERHQPLDQTAAEQEPRLRARAQRALIQREKVLRQTPACLYPAPRDAGTAGSIYVDVRSPAAALALRRLAARTGRSRPSAVLAAVCALLSRQSGYPSFGFSTLASNRFEQRLHSHIGTLAQATIARINVGTAGFDELVQRAWMSVVSASERGMYDIDLSDALRRRTGHERGLCYWFDPLFNSPVVDPTDDREPPQFELVSQALPETTLTESTKHRTMGLIRFDLYDYHDVMHVRISSGDTTYLPASAVRAMALALERLLVAAAEHDLDEKQIAAAIALPPVPRGQDWLFIDSNWVHLPEVQRLLDDALAPSRSQIFPGADGQELVAYVVADGTVRTPHEAHERCMAALPGRHTAMAPRHYVLCQSAPSDPTDLAGWGGVVAQGSGRFDDSTMTDPPVGELVAIGS